MKKQIGFKTKGMNRDLSVSAFNPEFSFENRNLRLSTKEGNTLMSWVNEKGTLKMTTAVFVPEHWSKEGEEDVYVDPQDSSWTHHDASYDTSASIQGTPIGTAIIDHKLIVFTHDVTYDYIYSVSIAQGNTDMAVLNQLYKGHLNFDIQHPLETLVSYEANNIQKVYFTDNLNQPRLINVANDSIVFDDDTTDTRFDFIPVIKTGIIDIQKTVGTGGLFAPGVIQYCYAYYNRYGQQSNIAAISPLQYIAHENRGASPEDKISCSFTISATGIDPNFEYVRLYSVQRTSVNGEAVVKVVNEFAISDMQTTSGTTTKQFTYTDIGTVGFSIDPMELLYIGGKEIRVLTMAEKDGTLFMGNITQLNTSIESIQDTLDNMDQKPEISFCLDAAIKSIPIDTTNGNYPYINYLNYDQRKITTFKSGEYYRFGFQLQKKDGEWSEPIYIDDVQNNQSPTRVGSNYTLPYACCTLALSDLGINDIYVNIRPVIVFPNIAERAVICQGVLNPTVFNIEDRIDKNPYAQPSWFFRPYGNSTRNSFNSGTQPALNTLPVFSHYKTLVNHCDIGGSSFDMTSATSFNNACKVEVQGSKVKYTNAFTSSNGADTNSQFFVDQSIITLNSPDIEFDTEVQNLGLDGLRLRIVGNIFIDRTVSSHSITTSSNSLETARNMGKTGSFHSEIINSHIYGIGEEKFNNHYVNTTSTYGGTHLIGGNLWNDAFALRNNMEDVKYDMTSGDPERGNIGSTYYYEMYETDAPWTFSSHNYLVNFFVHPWNRDNALNNDYRAKGEATSVLKTKKVSNMLISLYTDYLDSSDMVGFDHISTAIHLTENEQIYKKELPKQKVTSSNVSYYPNIDKILYNNDGYYVMAETSTLTSPGERYDLFHVHWPGGDYYNAGEEVKDPVHMKYKSTSHAIIALNAADDGNDTPIPILPMVAYSGSTLGEYTPPSSAESNDYTTFWGDTKMNFTQESISLSSVDSQPLLWVGELYRAVDTNNLFGGKSKSALKSNTWLVAGEEKPIRNSNGNLLSTVDLLWTDGDTYFQRYDCLKTYAFTKEDQNQLVEILSFMCETHVNIDGRYDNNRGSEANYAMSPENFNLLNPVYSQKNNFFSYKKTNEKLDSQLFKNWITYSKTKDSGSDIDLWTNITLGSVLELDGDKGEISSLNRFNDQIVAFQDSGISQILYNENVQISSTQGVPIEIANSGKVQGKRYISDTIGCSNRHSLIKTPMGIYFMDSNDKNIYLFNGQLNNISANNGFNAWCKQNIKTKGSSDALFANGGFVAHYDKINQEVLFTNSESALAWNEKLQTFTSFYDYGNTPYFENLDDVGTWIRSNGSIWKHQAGNYCQFFDTNKPYWMTLIGNPESQMDKIFTNLEFRACVDGDGTVTDDKFTPTLPFDSLEAWNEYQHGETTLGIKSGHDLFKHGDNSSALIRKYRIWRCDIPRDNYTFMTSPVQEQGESEADYLNRVAAYNEWLKGEQDKGIYRTGRHFNDRMRNPWLYLNLMKKVPSSGVLPRTEIHDVMMTYFD